MISDNIKVLLLDNVNQAAIDILTLEGYQVEAHSETLSEDVLITKIRDVHCVGIQSKTKLTKKILLEAKKLLVIGCFCANTSQIDLKTATSQKITVFNSSFGYSRSVAELVIAEIIMLSRHLGDRNIEMHQGIQDKAPAECHEIRGKTLGIIGYGHIGSQLSVLAESMGMVVCFHDVLRIMPLGTAKQVNSLEELLKQSDFVTIHVPETNETKNLISEREVDKMKKGSYLVNTSRSTIVQISAILKGLRNGHLSGVAIDMLPDDINKCDNDGLRSCENLILTPHIGGLTEEAQKFMGIEVATAIFKYINFKLSIGAIN